MKAKLYVILLTISVAILVAGIGTGLKTPTIGKSAPTSLLESADFPTDGGEEGIVLSGSNYMFEGFEPEGIGYQNVEEIMDTHTGFLGQSHNLNRSYQSRAQPEVVSELAPSTIVYIGGTTIPLSSYQTTYGKYLWIENQGLRQYASMKQYSSLPLIAYTSSGGPGEILEMYPSNSNQGTYQKTYYNFNPGHNRIPYRGDVVGRHYLLFAMNDQSSNAIIIDVNNGMIGGSPVMLGTMPSGGV